MSKKGHSTGMAGEFAVMEKLFRLGHEASLTLGNAKAIDIFARSPTNKIYQVSVKSIRGGGKWGVGKSDYSVEFNLFFALLAYENFEDLSKNPQFWVLPALEVMRLRRPWIGGTHAIYCGTKADRTSLEKFKDAWHLLT